MEGTSVSESCAELRGRIAQCLAAELRQNCAELRGGIARGMRGGVHELRQRVADVTRLLGRRRRRHPFGARFEPPRASRSAEGEGGELEVS